MSSSGVDIPPRLPATMPSSGILTMEFEVVVYDELKL